MVELNLSSASYVALRDDLAPRSADGSGNNLGNPDWGSAASPYLRLLPHMYGSDDGSEWDLWQQAGGTAPDPRAISNAIMDQPPEVDLPSVAGLNEYFQFFGQWITHDVAQAATSGSAEQIALEGSPAPFRRTPSILDEDGVRQQINQKTSYLDLGPVYGNSQTVTDTLVNHATGKVILGAGGLLPDAGEIAAVQGITEAEALAGSGGRPGAPIAGDGRASQTPELLIMHLTWARNHNFHADALAEKFPDWSGTEVYEMARALNEAEFQHVVYSEYVRKLIGVDLLSEYGGYDPTVNAATINEWSAVANRFGHDQSSNDLRGLNEDGSLAFTTTLAASYFRTALADTNEEVGQWLRGELSRVSQEIDGRVVDGNRNALHGQTVNDLMTIDIARARDHGVSDYNALRAGFGLETHASFEAFAAANGLGQEMLAALKSVYDDDIGDLDALVGGLLEAHAPGSQLGELFTQITRQQYMSLMEGDRYFYLNRFADHPEVLRAVEKTTLADIIDRTSDIKFIYPDAFLGHTRMAGTGAAEAMSGSAGADLMIGRGGGDTLRGGQGDDDIRGSRGADIISGNGGDDTLGGNDGRDIVRGGRGNDTILGGQHRDTLAGGVGADRVQGGGGDDRVSGGRGNDEVSGGKGDDIVSGDIGRDKLRGNAGDDIFRFERNSGVDVVKDFAPGADRLDISDYGFSDFAEIEAAMSQRQGSVLLRLSGEEDAVFLRSTVLASLSEDNFIFGDAPLS